MFKLKYAASAKAKLDPLKFETVWNIEPSTIVTEHRTSDVMIVRLPLEQNTEVSMTLYRKRYWYPSLKAGMRGFFRNTFFGRSRAAVEFDHLVRLEKTNLSLVRPLAYGEERSIRLLKRAFILTSHVAETQSLENWVKMKTFQDLTSKARRRFLCALGRWVACLHGRGFQDRDLFARNILVHPLEGGWRFSKIDSPSGTGGDLAPGEGAPYVRDLRDIDADLRRLLSRTDRLRCLMAYTGAGRVDREIRRRAKAILL